MLHLVFLTWFTLVLSVLGQPQNHHPDSIESDLPSPMTIIDYLSSESQYSYFLRHIQRHGLVPKINKMANVTVFAPVNSAFVDSELAKDDTAENLLRYFAAQRFRVSYLNGTAVVLDSLYETKHSGPETRTFPLKVSSERPKGPTGPFLVNDVAEIVEYDGYAKHQRSFIQAIDHLLPQAVSMCDMLMNNASESMYINGHKVAFVKKVFQSAFATHKLPRGQRQLSCNDFLANVSTLLLPTDTYIDTSMSDMEKRYFLTLHHGLENPDLYPTKEAVSELRNDALSFLSSLLLPDLVGGSNGTSGNNTHLSTWSKNTYKVSYDKSTNQITLNDKVQSVAGSTSLTFSDGLLHIFDFSRGNGTQPEDFLEACNIEKVYMNPRKTLYAMHFSQLARELRFYKKGDLIGDTAENQTILVDASDRDDFFDDEELSEAEAFIEGADVDLDDILEDDLGASSFSNRQQIMYKFIDGCVNVPNLVSRDTPRYHRLFDSKLCSRKRIDSCFKVKVSGVYHNNKTKVFFNDRYEAEAPFMAANNNSIYILRTDFAVPASFKNVMAQLISDGTMREHLDHVTVDKSSCLQTLKYLERHDLLSLRENYHGYTAFLPCGRTLWDGTQRKSNKNYVSWNSLGLVLKYLESRPAEFAKVFRGNVLEDLIYSDFGLEDSRESFRYVKTLNGDVLNISETYQEGDYNHVISLNETAISIPLNSDVLFNQGVIHMTSKVLLPSNFQISLRDLILADHASSADQGSFITFIEKFPKLASAIQLDSASGSDYSLLMPTSESLRAFNITSDFNRLFEFLELHLISNTDAATLLTCMGIPYFEPGNSSHVIQTNKTRGTFICHTNPSSGKTFLTLPKKQTLVGNLANDADHSVRIVNYGCSQQGSTNSSCVFLLERPLDVAWLDPPDNFLHVHIGWISVGIGIVIGVILFGFCTTTVALCLSRAGQKKTQTPELESNFTPVGSSYMPITSDEDVVPTDYDRGYETDVDMVRDEAASLLPKHGNVRAPARYDSTSPLGVPSAPRKIKTSGVIENINRDRNLPPV
ncbi:hypothetical protein OXX80_000134 [Metschnikowia pulcherrima]